MQLNYIVNIINYIFVNILSFVNLKNISLISSTYFPIFFFFYIQSNNISRYTAILTKCK